MSLASVLLRMLLFLPILSFVLLPSCGPEKKVSVRKKGTTELSSDKIRSSWIRGPSVEGLNQVRLFFTDEDGQTLSVYSVCEAWIYMKIHGHGGDDAGISFRRDTEEEDAWIIENFRFTMSGPWELHVCAVSGSGAVKSKACWEVPVHVEKTL